MAICHYYQHRQRAREAAWLEIGEATADAAGLWQRVSREAPKPQWRATLSRSRQPLRSF